MTSPLQTIPTHHLEPHDEDAQRVQDCEAHLGGNVGLQQRLVQHVCVRVAVSWETRHTVVAASPSSRAEASHRICDVGEC